MDDKKYNFEEIKFSRQNLLGGSTFLPLVKAKNQLQNFGKQKRCAINCLNVPNFCYFFKHGEKRKKLHFPHKFNNQRF